MCFNIFFCVCHIFFTLYDLYVSQFMIKDCFIEELVFNQNHVVEQSVKFKKSVIGCEWREMPDDFRFTVLHVAWRAPQQKRGRPRGGRRSPPSFETYCCWAIASSCVICTTEKAYMPSTPCVCTFLSTFDMRFKPTAKCIYLRYSVSYIKYKI